MLRHEYVLILNHIGKRPVEYIYNFGSTKGVELLLSKSGVSISVNSEKIYDKTELLSGDTYLFPDAIKKALLIYLIKYNKALKITSITVKIDDDEETLLFDKKVCPPVYSMINGDLYRKIPNKFSDKIVSDHLLKTTKSKYDKRIASLFAFLFSKSKEYETERFIYLWTSFNGMYSWISEFVAKANGVDKYRKEYKQIENFQNFLEVGSGTIKDEDKTKIASIVISVLKNIDAYLVNKNYIESGNLKTGIEKVLKSAGYTNLTAYGYLLTQLSYYFRCKIVHGSKPLLLFSYIDDRELHSLEIVNNLLEEFIDNNLYLYFDEKYIEEIIKPKAQTIKQK